MAQRGPRRMRSVFADLAVFNTGDKAMDMSRAEHAAHHIGRGKEAAARYRAAVLAHPDLAKELCLVFGYEQPEKWTGFVPSRLTADDKYNPSPVRAALVPIVVEALDRQDDHRDYDGDRLDPVPESAITDPMKEDRYTMAAKAQQARLAALGWEDEEGEAF